MTTSSSPHTQCLFWKETGCPGNRSVARPFRVVVNTMLSPHRQSVLTNACIKPPSADPLTRAPGTIYEPRGQVRLLGLLSESNPSQQEDYLDAGDGMLICMKRTKKRGRHSARKSCWDLEKVPNVSEASETEQESDPSRQREQVEGSVPPTPAPNLSPTSECPREPRPGSFPFHWMWESFSVKGQAVYQDCSSARARRPAQASSSSVREPPCTPALSSGSTGEQLVSSTKESRCLEEATPAAPPENLLHKHQKRHQHAGLPPGSSLLPLYWKIEARSEARKHQLRQERRRWLQLTQQLLNLESQSPRQERRLSAKQVEEKLKAELLCLATEPKEPSPQREKSRAKSTKKEPAAFQPAINRKVPNFKGLQRRFQEQLEHRKDQAKLTICKPFRIHSASSSQLPSGSKDGEEPEDPFNEVCQLWRVHWRAQSCPNFDLPIGPPIMPTKASHKRQQANRTLLLEWEKQERQEKRRAELRRTKEQQVQQEVAKCLAAYRAPGRSSGSFQRRREELRRQEKLRMEEYSLQLQEMHDRVESRPYLFERVMQANARQAVERRFSQVLSALGIDEELLWKHAVRQAAGKSSTKTMHRRTESFEDLREST